MNKKQITILSILLALALFLTIILNGIYVEKVLNDFCKSKGLKHESLDYGCYEIKEDNYIRYEIKQINGDFKIVK